MDENTDVPTATEVARSTVDCATSAPERPVDPNRIMIVVTMNTLERERGEYYQTQVGVDE